MTPSLAQRRATLFAALAFAQLDVQPVIDALKS
jgi:hypothetical protein